MDTSTFASHDLEVVGDRSFDDLFVLDRASIERAVRSSAKEAA